MENKLGEVCREKYWSEKTDQEKIFQLGEAVDMMAKRIVELETNLFDLVQHEHGKDGEIVIPLKRAHFDAPYWLRNILRCKPK